MKKSWVKDGNYVTIQSFMVKDLKLKGNELLTYAIIYGFSQNGESKFTGSLQYIADWTNSTKQGVMKNLKSLVEKGLIVKTDIYNNGVKFVQYHATEFNPMQQSLTGCETEFNEGIQQSLTPPIQQSLPNNIALNNKENNITNNIGVYIQTAEGGYLGTCNNIKLKETELDKLNEEYGTEDTQEAIDYLSEYIELKGYKAKSHYLALRKWVYTAVKEERIKRLELEQREKRAQEIHKKQTLNELKEFYDGGSFDTDSFFEAAVRKSLGDAYTGESEKGVADE